MGRTQAVGKGDAAGLGTYRRKRRFDVTPEPSGRAGRSRDRRLFVIQKHAARRLHWDFRLELDGVLKSWAVPKGPSDDPRDKRLAVEVEDHPVEYAAFEGRIPEGQYGAGTVELWDEGTWEPEGDPRAGLREGSLRFRLHGRRLSGRWSLVRMGGASSRARTPQWLLMKSRDGGGEVAAARTPERRRAGRAPLPRFLPPQLATLVADVPTDDAWLHEIKLDGYRMQARLDHGRVTLRTRAGLDWTDRYPGVARALADLNATTALLDGEVAVVGPDGVTHFQLLQNAGGARSATPPVYFAFDLLHLDGEDLTKRPLEERKRRLASVLPRRKDALVRGSDHVIGRGAEFHRAACEKGLEGIISKRRDGLYAPGRTSDWRKGKCRPRQEFVIGGYSDPKGAREAFGALLLGAHDEAGTLRYVGRVGTGFGGEALRSLRRRLQALERSTAPFAEAPRGADIHWVAPRLVAEVSFATWTNDRKLRQAAFEGLREDKDAGEIRFERAPSARAQAPPKVAPPKEPRVAGVVITHPERPIWRPEKLTKLDLARYVESVAPRMMPHVANRPLMVLRCSQGVGGPCFVQKHPHARGAERGAKRDPSDASKHLCVRDVSELVRLVQNGAVEIHLWGATLRRIERPDRLVFDLDPHESVPWGRIVDAARELRARLRAWKLPSYVKTTGGKGLHVVVPLEPRHSWNQVRAAGLAIGTAMARESGGFLTLDMAKSKRGGKIFLDTLRNVRGATSVAPYSPRARPGATISMPLPWTRLSANETPDGFTILSWTREGRRGTDPWKGWEADRARLPAALLRPES